MSREKGDKRSAILAAALDLFAENGFHGAPTSQIAERAGVGVGTIYRYFKDKDELIRELFREVHVGAREKVFSECPERLPVRERFITVFTRLLRFFLGNPKEFKFIEQFYFSPFSTGDGECENLPEGEETVKRLLLFAREQQIIKDAPLPVLESLAFGPVVALAKEHINRQVAVDEEMVRVVVEACWDGIKR